MATPPTRAGMAPIKAEFLAPRKPEPEKSTKPAERADAGAAAGGAPATAAAPAAAADGARPKKRQRGMNKPNERERYRPKVSGLCVQFASGLGCPYGDGCKYSHDLAEYMQRRPADLPGECPSFAAFGACRHGVLCRRGAAHLNADGTNIVRPGAQPSFAAPPTERNTLERATLQQLKQRKHAFPTADGAVARARELGKAEAESGGAIVSAAAAHGAAAAPEAAAAAAAAPAAAAAAEAAAAPAAAPAAAAAAARSSVCAPAAAEVGAGYGCSEAALRGEERAPIDLRGKLYLAPLTTVGNLPFRRLCVSAGADVTCSEMALATKLLQGEQSEWALLRRHESETLFGAQLAAAHSDTLARACEAVATHTDVRFVDINMGCPIDPVCNKGMGSVLVARPARVAELVRSASATLRPWGVGLTVKLRMGVEDKSPVAHRLVPHLKHWGAAACTLHGRSRQQRYSRAADWDYVERCAREASVPLIGNGDMFTHEDLAAALGRPAIASVMVARGALVKPWIFTELKERRLWDISAPERLQLMQDFVHHGLEHWGSDDLGVARTRHFLLEWLSFSCRYVPVGLLERLPPRIQDCAPPFVGRSDLETLLGSSSAHDWVRLSEMVLGPVPPEFRFTPKHKANAQAGPMVAEG